LRRHQVADDDLGQRHEAARAHALDGAEHDQLVMLPARPHSTEPARKVARP
jgi:hypothetical protein